MRQTTMIEYRKNIGSKSQFQPVKVLHVTAQSSASSFHTDYTHPK